MKLSKTSIIQLVVVTAIIFASIFIDFNKVLSAIQGEAKLVTQDKNCDLHKGPCAVTDIEGTKYTLEVFPKHIPLMEEISFKVTSSKQENKDFKLKIYAPKMFMGEFIFNLKQEKDGSYKSTGTLPTCLVGNMQWHVDIEKETLTKKIGARFLFETDI